MAQKSYHMKQNRKIRIISMLGLTALCMIGVTGCGPLPTTEDRVSGTHISQEEKDQALINKENWNSNRIDYIPTPTPTPSPTPAPKSEIATVTCTNKIYPSSVKKGDSFNICGLISTDIGTIDSVKGYFISKDGTVVTTTSDKPKSSTYELKRSIVDRKLAFGDLKKGEYICVIKAKGSDFEETEVMRFDFTISTKTVKAAALKPTTIFTSPSHTDTKTVSTETSTKKPEPTKAPAKSPAKPLTEAEKEIADKVANGVYPKNCKVTAEYIKSNNSGYEHYKVISKHDGKSVSVVQEYKDEASEIEAVDFYITTVGNKLRKFVYVEGRGWRQETVNKAHLTPVGNKTAVSINLGDYLDNTTGGQRSVETTSSEHIVSYIGIKNKSNKNISKDVTIITDRNFEIKSVKINIQDTNSIFRGEIGYSIDTIIEVSDKSKTKASVPEEVLTDAFD